MRAQKIIIIGAGILLALAWNLFVGSFVCQKLSEGKIYPNVYYADIKLPASIQEAHLKINDYDQLLLAKKITITNLDKAYETDLAKIGFSIDSQKDINRVVNLGHSGNFFQNSITVLGLLFKPIRISPELTLNSETNQKFKGELIKTFNVVAADASIDVTTGVALIKSDVVGNEISLATLDSQILETINNLSPATIKIESTAAAPSIKAGDIQPYVDQATGMIDKKITIYYEGKQISLSKQEIASWITFAKEGNVLKPSFDNTKIKQSIQSIAQNNDRDVSNQKINPVTRQVMTAGANGKKMDVETTYNQLIQNLDKAEISIKAPVETINFQTTGLYPGKYVVVIIQPIAPYASDMYTVENDKVIKKYYISASTNNERPFYPTPTGEFKIAAKSPDATSSLWNMKMPWWQQFSGGYGFHGPAEDNELVATYGVTSGGCLVFSSNTYAKEFYDWTEIGTPVSIIKATVPSCYAKSRHNYSVTGGSDLIVLTPEEIAELYNGTCVE